MSAFAEFFSTLQRRAKRRENQPSVHRYTHTIGAALLLLAVLFFSIGAFCAHIIVPAPPAILSFDSFFIRDIPLLLCSIDPSRRQIPAFSTAYVLSLCLLCRLGGFCGSNPVILFSLLTFLALCESVRTALNYCLTLVESLYHSTKLKPSGEAIFSVLVANVSIDPMISLCFVIIVSGIGPQITPQFRPPLLHPTNTYKTSSTT